MREEIEKYELFERFLKGELSGKELIQFKNKLNTDPGFAQEFYAQKQLFEVISENGYLEIKENIRHIHNRKTWINNIIKGLSIGISVGIITTLLFYIIRNNELKNEIQKIPVLQDTSFIIEKENTDQITKNEKSIYNKIKEANTYTISEEDKINEISNNSAGKDITNPEIINPVTNATIDNNLNDQNIVKLTEIPVTPIDDNKPDTTKEVDCKSIKIYADIRTEASCDNEATGTIRFDENSIEGGTRPYKVSIDNGKNYYTELIMSSIPAGLYHLFIKDRNDCITKMGAYRVDQKKCSYEFVFAPLRGDVWEVPTQNKQCKLIIFSKTGKIVFTRNIEEYEVYSWDGNTEDGENLPMGMYQFILECNNNIQMPGYITIVK